MPQRADDKVWPHHAPRQADRSDSARSRQYPPQPGWPHPDVGAHRDSPTWWSPVPDVAAMISPLFRSMVTSRLVTATAAHADHTLWHLGDKASEPGPHALLLISGEPHPAIVVPERPPWWQRTDEDLDETPTPTVRVASRLVGVGDGDDILDMLDLLRAVTSEQLSEALDNRTLFALLTDDERADIAARLHLDRPWTPPDPFPYAQALAQGLLWDPRTRVTGLAPTSKDPLTADTRYIGVAVTTLDTPTDRWVDVKHAWRGARDPDTGLPVTASIVPATAFAVLEDGTAIGAHRIPRRAQQRRTHTAVSNARIDHGLDRLTDFQHRPWLVDEAPPLPRHDHPPTQHSRELWDRLGALHTLVRTAFGYQLPS
jgi:hypothetical protein